VKATERDHPAAASDLQSAKGLVKRFTDWSRISTKSNVAAGHYEPKPTACIAAPLALHMPPVPCPTVTIEPMMTMRMSASITAYSTAVVPCSSFKSLKTCLMAAPFPPLGSVSGLALNGLPEYRYSKS
jgi:hypothetical protein